MKYKFEYNATVCTISLESNDLPVVDYMNRKYALAYIIPVQGLYSLSGRTSYRKIS